MWCIGIDLGQSQYLYDANIVMGYWSPDGYKDPIIDFSRDTVIITYDTLAFSLGDGSVVMSNNEGQLKFYFNGCLVANAQHRIIKNGEGLNPGKVYNNYCGMGYYYPTSFQYHLGLPTSVKDVYLLLHRSIVDRTINGNLTVTSKMLYSIIDFSNEPEGEVTVKNQPIFSDTILSSSPMAAVKHSNGRDWWIVFLDQSPNERYYTLLYSDGTFIEKGVQEFDFPTSSGGGVSGFSNDGLTYYKYENPDGLILMDFDRSTGRFSRRRQLPIEQKAVFTGGCMSPSGQFVYIGNGPDLYQVDITTDPMEVDTIALWDGTLDTFGIFQPINFGRMILAPDCRIYVQTTACTEYMHIIMQPDEKGKACDFRYRAFRFPTPLCNLPYHPNYRLDTPYPFCDPNKVVATATVSYFYPVVSTAAFTPHLYPNPGTDILHISLPSEGTSGDLLYTIYDISGKPHLYGHLHEGTSEIDTSALPSGIYIVTVTDSTGKHRRGKWVKM